MKTFEKNFHVIITKGHAIHIHHSVLPRFTDEDPYKQVYISGDRIIGAASPYVTTALNEGPIIEKSGVNLLLFRQ
ncbi:MAG: formyltransferase family protein [Gammaproteobacteria bacterium]